MGPGTGQVVEDAVDPATEEEGEEDCDIVPAVRTLRPLPSTKPPNR